MPTKKKAASPTPAGRSRLTEAFEKAVAEYGAALELLHQGVYEEAKSRFETVDAMSGDEPVLAARARTYARICAERMDPAAPNPSSAEERYYRAILHSNNGECDEAIGLLTQALADNPSSQRYLYARASAFALKGQVEAAIGDLRQAIAIEPQLRFQATNDPDFEKLREEPAFIDIIEPTPAGA